jgi:hypothetical protein
MKPLQIAFSHRPARRICGMTLVEMLVAVGVGSLVLLVMGMVFVTSSFNFAAMGNYMIMDRASRNALDKMTQDIRNSADLTNFTSSRLIFNYSGSTNLIYNYDQASGKLTSWKTGDAQTNVLLTGISNLVFTLYDNVPMSGGTNATTTVVTQGKGIAVSWKGSQTTLSRRTSEDMQQAMIVIRNKPVY